MLHVRTAQNIQTQNCQYFWSEHTYIPDAMASAFALSVLIPSNTHSSCTDADIACVFLLRMSPHCVFYGYIVYRLANTTGYGQLSEVSS